MAKIYANLCEAGERTCINAEGITQVPDKYLDATVAELTSRGRTDLTPEEVQNGR